MRFFHVCPPGTKFAMLARELKVEGGEIDFVFVDGDGGFYIVETKLKKNKGDKRKIFAQVDDYACSIWFKLKIYQSVDEFFSSCQENLRKELHDGSLVLDDYLQRELDLDDSPEQIKKEIKDSITNHRITFVIVMDDLDEDLQQQIIYRVDQKINTYGVELQKYLIHGETLIVPNVFRLRTPATEKKSNNYIHDDDGRAVLDRYEKHVKENSEFDSDLKSAILKLTSKFDEWEGWPWLHLSDMSLVVYFKKVKYYGHAPIKIHADGSIALRTAAFNDDSKTLDEFRADVSSIDQEVKEKISAGGVSIGVPHETWVPKIDSVLNVLEKYFK